MKSAIYYHTHTHTHATESVRDHQFMKPCRAGYFNFLIIKCSCLRVFFSCLLLVYEELHLHSHVDVQWALRKWWFPPELYQSLILLSGWIASQKNAWNMMMADLDCNRISVLAHTLHWFCAVSGSVGLQLSQQPLSWCMCSRFQCMCKSVTILWGNWWHDSLGMNQLSSFH